MARSNMGVDFLISICEVRTFQFWRLIQIQKPFWSFLSPCCVSPCVKSCCLKLLLTNKMGIFCDRGSHKWQKTSFDLMYKRELVAKWQWYWDKRLFYVIGESFLLTWLYLVFDNLTTLDPALEQKLLEPHARLKSDIHATWFRDLG